MSHRNKLIGEGETYHITQRAPGREMLFLEDSDYLNLLSILKKWVKEFNLNIFCFCLMPNHFHILLKINEANLPKAMHSLDTSYGMRFNAKYRRKGHVFCGTYRASMCLDDIHLIGSSIYIHLNPQKAGIVKDALEYRWSSANLYTNYIVKSFIDRDFILEIINDDFEKAATIYKEMLREYCNFKYENMIENPRAGVNFSKAVFKNLLSALGDRDIRKRFIANENKLDEMIEDFKNSKRNKNPEHRRAKIYLLEQLKSRGFKVTDIAKILNVSRKSLYDVLT